MEPVSKTERMAKSTGYAHRRGTQNSEYRDEKGDVNKTSWRIELNRGRTISSS
jgi:hypothetical protein